MFFAGGLAGATARTASAPLDRIKLLFQVQAMASSGTSATAYTSVGQAFTKIYKCELSGLNRRNFSCSRCHVQCTAPGRRASFSATERNASAGCREEGLLAFWKGNGTNIIRIFPYSAAQLSANDFYKRVLAGDGELTVPLRLTAGACAGMTATALTHPLDTVRLRLALPSHPYSGACTSDALRSVL